MRESGHGAWVGSRPIPLKNSDGVDPRSTTLPLERRYCSCELLCRTGTTILFYVGAKSGGRSDLSDATAEFFNGIDPSRTFRSCAVGVWSEGPTGQSRFEVGLAGCAHSGRCSEAGEVS